MHFCIKVAEQPDIFSILVFMCVSSKENNVLNYQTILRSLIPLETMLFKPASVSCKVPYEVANVSNCYNSVVLKLG